jgi:hypothetical protein
MAIIIPEPQVEQQTLSLPGAQQLGDAGLGSIAKGTAVAADQMRGAEIERMKKRNATRVFEAESVLNDMERDMRTQQLARKGSRAYGVTDEVGSWWETEPAKISAKLENETQKTLFAEAVARRRESSLNGFSAHESSESHAAANDATEARKVNAINYGAANFKDQNAVNQARTDIEDAIKVQRAFNGLPPDQVEAMRIDALTKLHTNVFENMLDDGLDGPERATAYFEANKAEIAGSVHDSLKTKLQTGRDLTGAQKSADDIWSRGLSETDALAAARKENEGQQREHALSLLRQQYADREQAITASRKAGLDAARSRFHNGDGKGKTNLAALTPSDLELLGTHFPGELAAMRSTTPQDQVNTDWDTYELVLEHARANPTDFRDNTDILLYRAKLNSIELGQLQKLQQDMRDGVPSSVMTLEQMISGYIKDGVDEDYALDFRRDVWAEANAEQQRLGRKLSGDEMQAVVDKQLIAIRVPDSGWAWLDSTLPRYQVSDAEEASLYDAIPEDVRQEAEDDLKAAGRAPTKSNVVALYNVWLDKQGNK